MRSPRKALFIILILLVTLLPIILAIGDPGWLTGWDLRVKLTIDSGDVDLPLTDFPILIYLSTSSGRGPDDVSFIFDEVGGNSLKIAVTTSDGVTECYVEVEKWDSGNEKAWLWAKIPSISNITDTEIYLYYDNDHADNTDKVGVTESAPAENVWDENFMSVWHMRDKTTSSVADSTGNDVDGTKTGANNPIVTANGIIDDAQDYSSDRITHPTFMAVMPDDFTIELFIKLDSKDAHQYIGQKINIHNEDRWGFSVNNINKMNFWGEASNGGIKTALSTGVVTTATWYYVAGVHTHGEALRVYLDLAKDVGDVLGTILDEGVAPQDFQIGNEFSSVYPFDGIIDEVRISNISRSTEWLKVARETGIDDLLDFGSEEERPILEAPDKLFGAGFNASSPYVSLYWKSNLTDITLFEVQNSTDKISWDYLGSNTTREYHDFQVVNGTERYYRVRACNFTGGVWDNSTWSDINFETVYFISEIVEVACKIRNFNASSIAVIAGNLNDGNLTSTFFVDGDWYNVSEINDIPGLDVRFNFTNIGGDPNCGCLDVYHSYTGHPQHDIKIQVWNFTSTSWYQIGTLIYNETAGWECSGLGNYAEHFFYNGSFWGRFYHEGQGHVVHEMQIDQIRLDVIYGEECPPCEEAPALVAMGKYYALAIILLILGILLGLGMRKR